MVTNLWSFPRPLRGAQRLLTGTPNPYACITTCLLPMSASHKCNAVYWGVTKFIIMVSQWEPQFWPVISWVVGVGLQYLLRVTHTNEHGVHTRTSIREYYKYGGFDAWQFLFHHELMWMEIVFVMDDEVWQRKNPLTFHYTGWLIGTLIMVYDIISI